MGIGLGERRWRGASEAPRPPSIRVKLRISAGLRHPKKSRWRRMTDLADIPARMWTRNGCPMFAKAGIVAKQVES